MTKPHGKTVHGTNRMKGIAHDPADHHDADLQALIAAGRAQGYLTFDQVNANLPDDAVDPEKFDALLVAL